MKNYAMNKESWNHVPEKGVIQVHLLLPIVRSNCNGGTTTASPTPWNTTFTGFTLLWLFLVSFLPAFNTDRPQEDSEVLDPSSDTFQSSCNVSFFLAHSIGLETLDFAALCLRTCLGLELVFDSDIDSIAPEIREPRTNHQKTYPQDVSIPRSQNQYRIISKTYSVRKDLGGEDRSCQP